MYQGLSVRDLELLGYTEIAPDSRFQDGVYPCEVFTAGATAGLRHVFAKFVYLKSRTTRAQADEILSKFTNEDDVFVLVPQSTKARADITSLCAARGIPCHVHEELLWERVYALFREYVESLSASIVPEKYYVQPRRDGDARSELDRDLLTLLRGTLPESKGKLFVLSAPAGVGKTTLARYLTLALARGVPQNPVIPVYVEAQHWSKLQLDTVEGLWEIIANSLSMFSSSLHLTEDLFDHMLKNGLVCFIFDGFDELCGHRQFAYRANDLLSELAKLVTQSDARILLTTRTAYWEAEVPQSPANVEVIKLAPFNAQQAKGYFAKYFADNQADQDRAFSLYRGLHSRIQPPTVDDARHSRSHFANLPLCVSMVAECVKLGAASEDSFRFERGIVHGFLRQICEREQERKKLKAGQDAQLVAFEELAMEHVDKRNPEFALDFLELVGVEPSDVGRMIDHPLLHRAANDRYRFAYDFLPHYFKASHVARLCLREAKIDPRSLALMAAEANGKGFVFEHVVDICHRHDPAMLQHFYTQIPPGAHDERSFLFHLAHAFAQNNPQLTSRAERTRATFESLFGPAFTRDLGINGMVFVGKMEGLDVSGLRFRDCRFLDVTFASCIADRNTRFDACTFLGELDFVGCDDAAWKSVQLAPTCTLHSPANLVWEKFVGSTVASKEEHIKDAMRLGLAKFWKHGRLKGSIRRDNWTTGSLGHSIYCRPLLDAMLRVGVLSTEGHISGVIGGGYFFNRECIADLQRFMDSRQLTGKLREVLNQLLGSH